MVTDDKLIQVKNLKKYYNKGTLKALDDVTVDIYKGDVILITEIKGSDLPLEATYDISQSSFRCSFS